MNFQVHGVQRITSDVGGGIGSYMGWAMAAIYMGGRLPQICLNVSCFFLLFAFDVHYYDKISLLKLVKYMFLIILLRGL